MKLGESGVTFRVSTEDANGENGFDMSSYTELSLTFTLPGGATSTKTTADPLTLGTSNVTDDDLGALLANEYVEYEIEAGFLSIAGDWKVYLTYTNTASTPDDVYIGDCVEFEVDSIC